MTDCSGRRGGICGATLNVDEIDALTVELLRWTLNVADPDSGLGGMPDAPSHDRER